MTTYQPEVAIANRRIDWPIIFFFTLAYIIAWGIFGIIALIARQAGLDSAQTLMAMGEAYQFEGVSLAVPYWLIYLLTRLADFSFSMSAISTALFSLQSGFFVSLFLRGAMGEELGLRGFALPRLQENYSPFRASLIIGLLWGAWHLPVLIGRDVVSVVAFGLLSFGLSFLFTYMFNGSGGSLIPVLLFHATQNWEEGFETVFPALVGTDWELPSTLVLLLIGIVAGVLVWRNSRS